MGPRPLTPRQRRFVAGYLGHGHAARAYLDAGFKAAPGVSAENGASRLLRHPGVKAMIAKAAESADLTAGWVLARLKAEAEREGEGSSHSARVKALEVLGRRFGLFPSKMEISGPDGGPIPINLGRLSHDQLASLDALLAAAEAPPDPGGGPGRDGPPAAG